GNSVRWSPAGGLRGTSRAAASHLPPWAAALAGGARAPASQLLVIRRTARVATRRPDRDRHRAPCRSAHRGALLAALRTTAQLRTRAHDHERLVMSRGARRGPQHGRNRTAAATREAQRRIPARGPLWTSTAQWGECATADAAFALERASAGPSPHGWLYGAQLV